MTCPIQNGDYPYHELPAPKDAARVVVNVRRSHSYVYDGRAKYFLTRRDDGGWEIAPVIVSGKVWVPGQPVFQGSAEEAAEWLEENASYKGTNAREVALARAFLEKVTA